MEAVLTEALHGLQQAVVTTHAVASRARAYSVAAALRADAEHLSVVERAVREVLQDLRGSRPLERAETLEDLERIELVTGVDPWPGQDRPR